MIETGVKAKIRRRGMAERKKESRQITTERHGRCIGRKKEVGPRERNGGTE